MTRRQEGKALRSGYTTGACAAAAAKAAVLALLNQKLVESVDISLPHNGDRVSFRLEKCTFSGRQATCSVIKDAGDDPDVTHGAEICASVSWKREPGIDIGGGEGVGVVTRPGLEIPEGMAAINPVPRLMIAGSVQEAAGNRIDTEGIRVTISVPKGEALARKTLNSRLGIVGGISILGTTGIVIPYSKEAYTTCISQALDVAVAGGCREVVLTTGRRSEKFAQKELPTLAEACFIQMGDFIGYSLEECAKRPLAKVTVWGMVGKMSKLAAGNLYTNVSDSRVDIDFLAEVAAGCGMPDETVKALRGAITANHFRRMLSPEHAREFGDELCRMAARNSLKKTGGRFEIDCLMTDTDGIVIGRADARP
ncbi:MAG: cobalt-precorrin-5B (C(1))-methyltransferase [Chloroflexota bacterium]|nr:cobalt-precorrin-5B (C(1))-methyltransferase [Chloroflexota bacterium]